MRIQPHFRLQLIWQSSHPPTANRQVTCIYSLLSGIERSSWHDPLPEWGRSIISNGNFHQIWTIEQAGKIRLTELTHQWHGVSILCGHMIESKCHWWVSSVSLIFPACSVSEIWWKFPLGIILLPHSGRGSCQLLLPCYTLFWYENDFKAFGDLLEWGAPVLWHGRQLIRKSSHKL